MIIFRLIHNIVGHIQQRRFLYVNLDYDTIDRYGEPERSGATVFVKLLNSPSDEEVAKECTKYIKDVDPYAKNIVVSEVQTLRRERMSWDIVI